MANFANVLSLGDRVMARVYPWTEPFPAVVVGFPNGAAVAVTAVEQSADPFVDNDFTLPFSQVAREAAESPAEPVRPTHE